jgi:cysteine desulfurase
MAIKLPVYFDNHATTPVDPRVVEAMVPYFTEKFGNAASRNHEFGWKAEEAVENARGQIAKLINATPKEIVFTSGATESTNLAIKGVAEMYREKGNHIITQVTEHKATLDTCKRLEKYGYEVTYLPVEKEGRINLDDLRRAITPKTILISIMYANNEIGVVQPIAEIGKIAKEKGVFFHVDAVQAVGKIPVDVQKDGIDLMSISGHKIYGPKGVGALYVRSGRHITPRSWGGHAERDRRAGTENVPGIVGLGKAAEVARTLLAEDSSRISALRDRLETALLERIPNVLINGDRVCRVPNTSNMSFPGAGGEALLIALDLQGVACSTGAACSSGSTEPSHVLLAAGLSHDDARSSLRFSLGRPTTIGEIDHAIEVIRAIVERIRALSPREQESAAAIPAR